MATATKAPPKKPARAAKPTAKPLNAAADPFDKQLAKKISQRRTAASLAQEQAAKKAGWDARTWSKYERAERSPGAQTLARICKTLKCTPNDLVPGPWSRTG